MENYKIEFIWDKILSQEGIRIRELVFVEEQRFDINIELDDNDKPNENTDHCYMYIIKEDSGEKILVGYLRTQVNAIKSQKSKNKLRLHFGRICIHPNYRKFKLGKKLMENAIERLKNKGYTEVWLNSQHDKTIFYNKCGFVEEGDYNYDEYKLHVDMVNKSIQEPQITNKWEWNQELSDNFKNLVSKIFGPYYRIPTNLSNAHYQIFYHGNIQIGCSILGLNEKQQWVIESFGCLPCYTNREFEYYMMGNCLRLARDLKLTEVWSYEQYGCEQYQFEKQNGQDNWHKKDLTKLVPPYVLSEEELKLAYRQI